MKLVKRLIQQAIHARLWLFCVIVGLALPAAAAEANPRLNIVFLLADDLGWSDLSCYGSTFYETPNLDRMAREGGRFTQAYAACPVCSPTRASLLTGRYPQRTGVTDFIGATQPDKWNRNTRLLPAAYRERLELEEGTVAKGFKAHGYATFFAGKWHLGPEGFWPENQGFDINKGGIDRGGPYGGNKYFSPYGNPRLEDGPPGEHLPDRIATETAKFIQANKECPFLAWVPFYDVHTPLMARADLRKKYEEKARAVKHAGPDWGKEGEREVRLVQDHAVYGGMVEAMDQAVGKILKALEENGMAQHTLVLFSSDNGGLSTSEGHPTSNLPLRGGKGWLYEGGIREPLIVRWPGVVKAGAVFDSVVSSPDIFPTLLEAAGWPLLPKQHLDGVSFVPVLQGQARARGPVYWHYPHYGNQGGFPGGAVRDGDWKLIEHYEDGAVELYNLREDISESRNLAAAAPERVKELQSKLAAWRTEVGARMPTPNAKYDPNAPRPKQKRAVKNARLSSSE
ncbi:MAG: sulfatase [Verrucomicrobiota bacterium]